MEHSTKLILLKHDLCSIQLTLFAVHGEHLKLNREKEKWPQNYSIEGLSICVGFDGQQCFCPNDHMGRDWWSVNWNHLSSTRKEQLKKYRTIHFPDDASRRDIHCVTIYKMHGAPWHDTVSFRFYQFLKLTYLTHWERSSRFAGGT